MLASKLGPSSIDRQRDAYHRMARRPSPPEEFVSVGELVRQLTAHDPGLRVNAHFARQLELQVRAVAGRGQPPRRVA